MNEIVDLFPQNRSASSGSLYSPPGLHSRQFFQCALLLQDATVAAQVCGLLAEKLGHPGRNDYFTRRRGNHCRPGSCPPPQKKHIFAEKNDSGGLVLRRGFTIAPNEKFLVAEDVVTRGGRVQEAIQIVRQHGGIVAAAGAIVDRSVGLAARFWMSVCLAGADGRRDVSAGQATPDLANIPAVKLGSK